MSDHNHIISPTGFALLWTLTSILMLGFATGYVVYNWTPTHWTWGLSLGMLLAMNALTTIDYLKERYSNE